MQSFLDWCSGQVRRKCCPGRGKYTAGQVALLRVPQRGKYKEENDMSECAMRLAGLWSLKQHERWSVQPAGRVQSLGQPSFRCAPLKGHVVMLPPGARMGGGGGDAAIGLVSLLRTNMSVICCVDWCRTMDIRFFDSHNGSVVGEEITAPPQTDRFRVEKLDTTQSSPNQCIHLRKLIHNALEFKKFGGWLQETGTPRGAFQRRSRVPFFSNLGVRLAETGSRHVDSKEIRESCSFGHFMPCSQPLCTCAKWSPMIRMTSGSSLTSQRLSRITLFSILSVRLAETGFAVAPSGLAWQRAGRAGAMLGGTPGGGL
eukprot:gene24832-biopygen5964